MRIASRSGGVFPAISNYVLERSGVVYGAVLADNLLVEHIRVTDDVGVKKTRGSKYLQSHIGETYINVKKDLAAGRLVLFSGTPCQVNGLLGFLGGNKNQYENLITVDIFCHGVPSEAIWKEYVNDIEKKSGKKVSSVDFRNKYKYGWMSHVETFYFEDGASFDSKQFRQFFLSMEAIRPSCFHCRYKNLERAGDISLGDAWGIEKKGFPEFDNNGESIVLINSEKGEQVFSSLDDLSFFECNTEDYLQPAISYNYSIPASRRMFWKKYQKNSFPRFVTWYNKHTYLSNVRTRLKAVIGRK